MGAGTSQTEEFKNLTKEIELWGIGRLIDAATRKEDAFKAIWKNAAEKFVKGTDLEFKKYQNQRGDRNPWAYTDAAIWAQCFIDLLDAEFETMRESYKKLAQEEMDQIKEPHKSILSRDETTLTVWLAADPKNRPIERAPLVLGTPGDTMNSHTVRSFHGLIKNQTEPMLTSVNGWHVLNVEGRCRWSNKLADCYDLDTYPIGKVYYRITTNDREYVIDFEPKDSSAITGFIESQKKRLSIEVSETNPTGPIEFHIKDNGKSLHSKLNIDPKLLVDCKVELVLRNYDWGDDKPLKTRVYKFSHYRPKEGTLVVLVGKGLEDIDVQAFEYQQDTEINLGGIKTRFKHEGSTIQLVPPEASKRPEKDIHDTISSYSKVRQEIGDPDTAAEVKTMKEGEKKELEADLATHYSLAAGRIINDLREDRDRYLDEENKLNKKLLEKELVKELAERSVLLRWLATKTHVDFKSHHWLFGDELDNQFAMLLRKPINHPDARLKTGWQNQINDITSEVNRLLTGDNSKIKFITVRPRSIFEIVVKPKEQFLKNPDAKVEDLNKAPKFENEEIKQTHYDALEREHVKLHDSMINAREARKAAMVALDNARELKKNANENDKQFGDRKNNAIGNAEKRWLNAIVEVYSSIFNIWLLPDSPWKMEFLDDESRKYVDAYEALGKQDLIMKIKNASEFQIKPAQLKQ